MLYITTRENRDAFTAARTLAANRAADGGFFVPFRLPECMEEDILALKHKSFGQCVADVLNLFFSARLSGWDVDFAIGRNPVRIETMNHRLVIAELWNNPKSSFSYMEKKLNTCLTRNASASQMPTEWTAVAIRLAVIFGLYGELMQSACIADLQILDIAVSAADLPMLMACWYARAIGLPIGTVVCGCSSESGLWDLISRGECSIGAGHQAAAGIERLIHSALGSQEVHNFLSYSERGRTFSLSEEAHFALRSGLFAAVIGNNRINAIVRSVEKTNRYTMEANTALAYGALQDYRAGNTEGRTALLISVNPQAGAQPVTKGTR